MIRYSCHSENFASSSGEETFRFIKALGFDCIDVASRSLVPQKEIQADASGCAARFADLSERFELPLSELFLSAVEIDGAAIAPCSPKAHTARFDKAFDQICLFAEKAGFRSIMGSAGEIDETLGFEETFERTAATMKRQTEIAAGHGLSFHVEPSRLSLLHTVPAALAMAEAVPGLKYTLDFLHYHIQGIPLEESMKLIPYAGHMHARQARVSIGKCDFAQGEIDYGRIVSELKWLNWSGDIAMEFWCTKEMEAVGIQAVEQNLVMRYCLKTLYGSAGLTGSAP